jgi:hypothetical protein
MADKEHGHVVLNGSFMDNEHNSRVRKAHDNFGDRPRTFRVAKLALCCLALMVSIGLGSGIDNSVPAQQSTPATSQSEQDQGEGSRQILLEEFTRARPAGAPVKKSTGSPVRRRPTSAPRYSRKSPPLLAALKLPNLSTAEIGVTIWRLRPSQGADSRARVLVMENGQTSQWTPERVEAGQLLRLGDRVRISIESPRAGYLYVVDREQYSDGTLGDALLIFPTTRARGGDNRVTPGALIDVPAQDDSPPYFTLTSNHRIYAGEVLMVIVVPQPIKGLDIGPQPLPLPLAEVAKWQKLWSTQAERFEMDGGAGKAWTPEEQAAALTSGARTLTQDEPAPQTIYRVALSGASGFMVAVPLRCTR